MPRALRNDICELFGYSPDEIPLSIKRREDKSCPFVPGLCIKHSHPQEGGKVNILGVCSVVNKHRDGQIDETITCVNRMYAENYKILRNVVFDAFGEKFPSYTVPEFISIKNQNSLPGDYCVLFGQNSGKEISVAGFSLDWVITRIQNNKIITIIPVEIQSSDTTGNYHANWNAYMDENWNEQIPDSKHGMNFANIWKRIIPQLILKGVIVSNCKLCSKGNYFIVPDVIYKRFEMLVGNSRENEVFPLNSQILTIMTYTLGSKQEQRSFRGLDLVDIKRVFRKDFVDGFVSGNNLNLDEPLEDAVIKAFEKISS
jgi:hypothetical protein